MSDGKWLTLLNAYWLNVGGKVAEIAYFLLLVSILEKVDLGKYNSLMTVSLFFLTAFDFGMSQVGLRTFSQGLADIKTTISLAKTPRLVLLLLAILSITAGYSLQLISKESAISLALLAIYQALNFLHSLLLDAIRGANKQTTANKIIGLEATLKLVLLACLKEVFIKVGLHEIIGSLLISKIILLIITNRITNTLPRIQQQMPANIAKLNPIIFDGQLNYLWISLLTVLQNRLDWLMVSMYMDNRAIATYSVVNRYFEILLFVIGIGFTTLYPWICRAVAMRDTREDKLLKTLRRLLFIPVPLVVVSAAYAFPFIDSLFWHQQYQDAANANLVLLPCAGLATANMLIYYDLMAHKQERYLIFACLASTSLQALFNLFAIPSLGINGAIAGMWLMNISNLAIFSLIYMTRTQSKSEIGSIILIAALMSLLLLAGMALPLFALMSATVLLTVILGALLWKKRNSLLQQPRTEAV